MCQSTIHDFLKNLPKCEHHMHLEGALTPQVLFSLAAKNNIELPADDPAFASPEDLAARYQRFTSLDDFLHYYYLGMSTLISSADFETLAWDYFQRAAADGVAHAEIFIDPQAHQCRGVAYDAAFAGVQAARERAWNELGLSSEVICCFLRHLPPRDGIIAVEESPTLQEHLRSGKVRGIGLDSSELNFPPDRFVELYQAVRRVHPGVRLTAHAGEEGPASYIASALDDLGVSRIDHGIRLAEDERLLERVAKQGTMLTVCPYSNVLLHCAESVKDLPIRLFLDKGVKFSINSDDPAYFGGHYILDNYCAVQDAFDLSTDDWRLIVTNSVQGSWCSEDRKAIVMDTLAKYVSKWESTHSESGR